MRILVLSFYFRPDLSAGSFRTTALVEALRAALPAGSTIDVITTSPNRYRGFAAEAPPHETRDGVTITRLQLPAHQSGMRDQSRAFLAFARGVNQTVASREYDLVFATSSRLMTAVLGAYVAKRTHARLYLDIRDIFVDTIGDVMPRAAGWLLTPAFSAVERWAIRRANKVNLVSQGFATYFESRYPRQRFSFFTNGIDDEFLAVTTDASAARVQTNDKRTRPLEVLYAGNIGEGQGLHTIIPALAERLKGRANFVVIGDGGRRPALELALTQSGATNVELRPPVNRVALLEAYRDADILFLHLNDYEAFKKVLPSKLFEYAAMGKPIWAGVAGYAAEFTKGEIDNSAVFQPCDVDGALRVFETLTLEDTARTDFVAKYARESISSRLAMDIVSVAAEQL